MSETKQRKNWKFTNLENSIRPSQKMEYHSLEMNKTNTALDQTRVNTTGIKHEQWG